MENNKALSISLVLKGINYLMWSPQQTVKQDNQKIVVVDEDKWIQEDLIVMSIIQNSLEPSILEAYSYYETAKYLWDTLQKVYGNMSILSCVFEVKKAINTLTQEDIKFTKHFGKFRSLRAEFEMLRPSSTDPDVLNERHEQDKVFRLFLTLNPTYNDLIKYILRSEKLPTLEDVFAQIQKEQRSMGLFAGKVIFFIANKAEEFQSNKLIHKKKAWISDHCKIKRHV